VSTALFVDTWSHGRFFTDEVAKELTKHSKVYFLHSDKFYEIKKSYPAKLDALNVCDLDSYNMSVDKALDDIQPDVVIFISMHSVFHRWINQICELRGVKTLFFMHGVRFIRNEASPATPSKRKTLSQNLKRAIFYIKHWYYFGKDLVFCKKNKKLTLRFVSSLFKSFFEMFLNNHRFSDCPKYKWGLQYEIICINTKYDELYFENFVGKKNVNKMVISGHLTSRRAAIDSFSVQNFERNQILFISQPLVSANYIEAKEYFEILLLLKEKIECETSCEFVVRPHPRDDLDFIEKLIDNQFKVSTFECFSSDLAQAKVVVGFNSSALLGCMDMGLPIAIVAYNSIPRLEALQRYDLSIEVDSKLLEGEEFTIWLQRMAVNDVELKIPRESEKIISDQVLSLF
jgi:hypothetical protein